MKKILITGASGFIGSFLVKEALGQGYEVHAGVRSTSSRKYLSDSRIKFVELDFHDPEKLTEQFRHLKNQQVRFDFVIHNAGITKARSVKDFFTVNYQYTKNLVSALISSNSITGKFIYISSLTAYGPGKDSSPIKHTDAPQPITSYGESKLHAEKYLQSLKDFPYLIIRPAAVYGPHDHEFYVLYKVLNRGIEPYIGSRNQLLSFIYVSDLAKAVFKALESQFYSRAYFISDGAVYTTRSFNEAAKRNLHKKTIRVVIPASFIKPIAFSIEKISSLLGTTATFNRERAKEFEAINWSCEIAPLKNDLNFSPEYNLESGMRETISWYKKEHWL